MGAALNEEHDNLWFTILCKRPAWLTDHLSGERPGAEIVKALGILGAMMTGRPLEPENLAFLASAAAEIAAWGHDDRGSMKGSRSFRIIADYLASPPPRIEDRPWGWKEPNSHIVLPEIIAVFPDVRYVHMIRHPLDIAWSSNSAQLRLWGHLSGIEPARIASRTPAAQLAWWLLSTRQAVETCASLEGRFMLLRYESFCEQPLRSVAELAEFAGLHPDEETMRRAVASVELSASTGRWRDNPLDVFEPELLSEIGDWGYEIAEDARYGS